MKTIKKPCVVVWWKRYGSAYRAFYELSFSGIRDYDFKNPDELLRAWEHNYKKFFIDRTYVDKNQCPFDLEQAFLQAIEEIKTAIKKRDLHTLRDYMGKNEVTL